MADAFGDRLTARGIDDAEAPAQLALVWRPRHGPAVRELLAHAKRAFAG